MRLTDHDDRMRLAFLALIGGLAAAMATILLQLALRGAWPPVERVVSVPAAAAIHAAAGSSTFGQDGRERPFGARR